MRIGVLALQGAFIEHRRVLEDLGAGTVEVRLPDHLPGLDGIIVPGGESTTMSRLMVAYGLLRPLQDLARQGMPVLGTCAGLILLARHVPGFTLPTLGLMDITVRRNAFGSQVDSFEADLDMPALGPEPFHAVFIRAPVIEDAPSGSGAPKAAPSGGGAPKAAPSGGGAPKAAPSGSGAPKAAAHVEVLARLPGGVPPGAAVAARQGRLVGVAFHPELVADNRLHRYFLGIVSQAAR